MQNILERLARFPPRRGGEVDDVIYDKDRTGLVVALEVNIPNYATALVSADEAVEAISSLGRSAFRPTSPDRGGLGGIVINICGSGCG